MRARQLALLVIWLAGCQAGDTGVPRATGSNHAAGSDAPNVGGMRGESPIGAPGAQGSAIASAAGGSSDAASAVDDGSAHVKSDDPESLDVGKAIAELGAIPAWQAVVDRAQYLARRGTRTVVFGTLASAIEVAGAGDAGLIATPYTWLVDDTEGNGALAIRVALGPKASDVKQRDRVALGGGWALDAARTWFWKVDAVSPLPAAPTDAKDPMSTPGHVIVNGDLPSGAKPISKADEGDAAWFQLDGAPPANVGDGWPVADELGNPVYALLDLPGEHTSYGGQDMRAADERWQLKRGATYVVRIGPVHHHAADKPVTVRARTAPIRVK
jgi:hypothetical protein